MRISRLIPAVLLVLGTIPGHAQTPRPAAARLDTAVFAGGCFWGVEAVFEELRGVRSAVSGYAGGGASPTTYPEVSSGRTRYAEAVRVVYDPAVISYAQLLDVFFTVAHDPTQRNRQGPDVGPQYRSAIFHRSAGQQREAEGYIRSLGERRVHRNPVATQVARLDAFHEAEEYHQDFLVRNPRHPYIVAHDLPKLRDLRSRYPALLRR